MTEKQFLAQVLQLARLTGWLTYHVHDSRRSTAGFPDLVLTRPGRLVFAELKTDEGKVTANQQAWLDALRESGPHTEVYLWRPGDWDTIETTLKGE